MILSAGWHSTEKPTGRLIVVGKWTDKDVVETLYQSTDHFELYRCRRWPRPSEMSQGERWFRFAGTEVVS